jgi:pyridoxine 5-phosphate synthase
MKKLGVNIDHIATLRQARKGNFPDPVIAAGICELAGCDSIVCHLREDRRHIQERDVRILKETVRKKLNLEMSLSKDIIEIALNIKPHQVTIVPEKREELTTEGGLNVENNFKKLQQSIKSFHNNNIVVSIFIEPDIEHIEKSRQAGADAIEIHTGKYANYYEKGAEKEFNEELSKIEKSIEYAKSLNLKIHCGHGLDYQSIIPLLNFQDIEEFNIGYSIICSAIFTGLYNAVQEMVNIIKK